MTTNRFADLQAEMDALIAKMESRGREAFKEGAAEIFESDPTLISFSWTQYTPYFNDGDACVFGVNSYIDAKFDGDVVLEDWEGSEWSRKYVDKETSEQQMETADAAAELVESLPEEVMKSIFGDHVRVTVYRDKVEVEEYEHD